MEAAQRVDRVLAAIGAGYLTVAELAAAAGCSASTVRLRLHDRYEAGEIEADRTGWPYRYRLTEAGRAAPATEAGRLAPAAFFEPRAGP